MNTMTQHKQRGLSITGLIMLLVVLGAVGVVGMKVVPTVTEYRTISNSIYTAKRAGSSADEIRNSFDKQADTGYVESIAGKDLDIETLDSGLEVAFAYEKKIPLFGPVSLVIDYAGSTSPKLKAKPAVAATQ